MENSPTDDALEPEDLDDVAGGHGGGAGTGKIVFDEGPEHELGNHPL
jgi:hypothetical protein